MKFGLLSAALASSICVVAATVLEADAATIFGAGPDRTVGHFDSTVDTHIDELIDNFKLNIFNLELSGDTPLSGTLTRTDSATETTDSQIFEVNSQGNFSLDIPLFVGDARRGDYQLELRAGDHTTFDFTHWSIVLGAAPGIEACDTITGTLGSGAAFIDESCYDPREKLQVNEAGQRFIEITSSSGVIIPENDSVSNPVEAYRNPEIAFIVEGSREYVRQGYVRGSSADSTIRFGGDQCLLGDSQDNVVGISDSCRELTNDNLARVSGLLELFDDEGNSVQASLVATAQGETTGLPESVPDPSLVVGLLATAGVAVGHKLRRTQ